MQRHSLGGRRIIDFWVRQPGGSASPGGKSTQGAAGSIYRSAATSSHVGLATASSANAAAAPAARPTSAQPQTEDAPALQHAGDSAGLLEQGAERSPQPGTSATAQQEPADAAQQRSDTSAEGEGAAGQPLTLRQRFSFSFSRGDAPAAS